MKPRADGASPFVQSREPYPPYFFATSSDAFVEIAVQINALSLKHRSQTTQFRADNCMTLDLKYLGEASGI